MTAEDDILIETYVHRPDALSLDDRRRAEALIEDDAEAKTWATQLRAMYEAFYAMPDETPRVVDRFVDQLFGAPTVVSLTPAPRAQPTVFSADTGTAARFEPLAVLSSKENGVMVRILHDTQRHEGRVYVLARDDEAYRHALFESGDETLQVPLREDGVGRFSNPRQVEADALRHGRIRRCIWSGPLVPGETPSSSLQVMDGYTVRAAWTGPATLRLQSTTREADRPSLCWVGIDDGDSVRLIEFEDETAELTVPLDDTERTLRLFG